MPLAGGAADKYGNRYEGRWTVYCLARILRDECVSIQIERPGDDFAEFQIIDSKGVTEFHQVKRQNGGDGRWRIKELDTRGVLKAFWEVSAHSNQRYVFVSTDNIEILTELVERAKSSVDWNTYEECFLTDPKYSKSLSEIAGYVAASSQEEVYNRLKQLTLQTISEDLLRQDTQTALEPFTIGHSANTVDVLAQYILDNVHKILTRDDLLAHLAERQILKTLAILDEGRIRYALPQKPNRFISRASIIRSLMQHFSPDLPIIIVKGVDGAGKTTLLTEFIEQNKLDCFYFFAGNDWTSNVLAFLREMCTQLQKELQQSNNLDVMNYEELKDTFGRLCRLIPRAVRQRGNRPYYFVIDGLENFRDEPGRKSILELIQLDFVGLYVLGSSARQLPIASKHHIENLDYFTPADTEKYLSEFIVENDKIQTVYRISEGLPAYLNQLRREFESGASIDDVISNLPTALYDLFQRDWSARDYSGDQLNILAILAQSEMVFNLESLAAVANWTTNEARSLLLEIHLIELSPIDGLIRFPTDAHRSFIAEKLNDRRDYVNLCLIEYYNNDILSEEALERLPMLLNNEGQLYSAFKRLINVEYLYGALKATSDMSLLRRNARLILDAALRFGGEQELLTVSKFSLISSLLRTLTEEAADEFEVQALLALGEYDKCINLAYNSPLLEDKLELLATIGRMLKQNNSTLLDNVLQDIDRIISEIVPNVVIRERAVDIASNLFVLNPQAAIVLLEKVAETDGQYSIDILLAVLALRLEHNDEAIPNTLKSKITNEKLREFISANSQSVASLTAQETIAEADKVQEISGKLFLLRSWCNENQHNRNALQVIEAAIRIIQEADHEQYSPSMLHLRQFAEPLVQYSYVEISRLLDVFRDLKAASLQLPYEEALSLELILLKIEAENSKEKMHEGLLDLYISLAQIENLDILCYGYAKILVSLKDLDSADELRIAEDIKQNFPSKFSQLLLESADQYKVTRRILQELCNYDPHYALRFAKQLNTSMRRDRAYSDIVRSYAKTISQPREEYFLNEVFDLISNDDMRGQSVVSVLEIVSNREFSDSELIAPHFISRLDILEDSVDLSFGYCFSLIYYMKGGFTEEAEAAFEKMQVAWSEIDILPERVDVGFNLVIELAPNDLQRAHQFYERVSQVRNTTPLSNRTLVEIYANMLNLLIRTATTLNEKRELSTYVQNIVENIRRLPSNIVQVMCLSDLGIRLNLRGFEQESADILRERIYPILENTKNKADKKQILYVAMPLIYQHERAFFYDSVDQLGDKRDSAIYGVITYLISQQSPMDSNSTENNNFTVTNPVADQVSSLITMLHKDSYIHNAIRLLVDAAIKPDPKLHDKMAERCSLSDRTAIAISRRLNELISERLPDPNNIEHEGYKIACQAYLKRLSDIHNRTKPRASEFIKDWTAILADADRIPNLPDRILVLAWLSNHLKKYDEGSAKDLVTRAQELAYKISNVLDRSDSLTEVARAWHGLGEISAPKFLLQEAMAVIEGLSWDETKDQVAGQILQAAHAVDPDLASSLTTTIDNPFIQRHLKGRVVTNDIFKEPERLSLSEDSLDYRPVVNAAHEIVKAMNSGTYHTVLDKYLADWLRIGSILPFDIGYPIRLLEIQNYIGQQGSMRSSKLVEIHSNLLDTLKLVGLISSHLYKYDKANFSENTPDGLKMIRVDNREQLGAFLNDWLNKEEVTSIDIYDSNFSYDQLYLVAKHAQNIPVNIFTSWSSQHVTVKDQSVDNLFQSAWNQLADTSPYLLRVSLLETESGLCPLEGHYFFLNHSKGLELIPNRNLLDTEYMTIRELTSEAVDSYLQQFRYSFLISPSLDYKDERIILKTIQIG